MKLKKVLSICKANGLYYLYDRIDRSGEITQWLGDGYAHDYIYGRAEIRFVRGRLRFTDEEGKAYTAAPFPSMVVIYNGNKEVQE